jgi:NitT/TauT family transport system substrate-binding protein
MPGHGLRPTPVAVGIAILCALASCSGPSTGAEQSARGEALPLRLGYFPNVTHATAIVGIQNDILADALGSDVTLAPQAFNAGPEVVEALFSGALDASYIGPNPAINAFVRSNGEAIRIVAGATSGGAALVVRPDITDPQDLAGATLATPQLGNTQDVALRAWLAEQGFETDLQGGGEVAIVPQPNGQSLEAFMTGEIDGAWLPEPWATRMVVEAGGSVLVDERDLWPNGAFVTTHLVVATSFLREHPEAVRRLLAGHVQATEFVVRHPAEAQQIVAEALAEVTGTVLPVSILATAWENLTFTVDPIASSLIRSAANARAVGLLDSDDLDGIYALDLLDAVLAEADATPVPGP